MQKRLHATVDFYDDLIEAERFFEPQDIDAMMACLRGMGVSRVDWVVDTVWAELYRLPVGPYANVLHCAIERAHAHGMELHALIKPFERGFEGPRSLYPHTAPQPEGVPLLEDRRGVITSIDPFLLAHSDMRYRRRPGDEDPGKPVRAIRLIKSDTSPTRLQAGHLSIHVSERNGELHPYAGGFTLREDTEWRDVFLAPGDKRVLTLDGLDIGPRWRYVFVKCSLADAAADFGNTPLELMELVDANGDVIPVTPAESRIGPERMRLGFPEREITTYGRHPAVRAFFSDPAKVAAACADFYQYDRSSLVPYRGGSVFLDGRGYAGVARGKSPTLLGALSPHHPEVRAYWMDQITGFLDAGVDGVNLRHGGHGTKSHEREAYGFDAPVLARSGGRTDYDVAHRVNGEAYTAFLREASEAVRARGKAVTLHVQGSFWYRDERTWRTSDNQPAMPNMTFEWERWLRQGLADIVYLKGLLYAPARNAHVIDAVTRVAGECGLPVIHCGLRLNTPVDVMTREMRRTLADDRFAAFDLYEVANFARLTANGEFVANPLVVAATRELFGAQETTA